jgi:HPt (histidine-containing phosphotransfer) domain-containing protein
MNHSVLDTAEPVLDFEALKARCLGSMELVERVLSKFTGQLDQDLDELESAIAVGDSTLAAQLAHRIKGIAASVSARSLFDNASTAEEAALASNVAGVRDHLNRMRNDRSKLTRTLSRTGRGSA